MQRRAVEGETVAIVWLGLKMGVAIGIVFGVEIEVGEMSSCSLGLTPLPFLLCLGMEIDSLRRERGFQLCGHLFAGAERRKLLEMRTLQVGIGLLSNIVQIGHTR